MKIFKSKLKLLVEQQMDIVDEIEILELEDGWTIITEDGTKAAHYENTILITKGEPEILSMKKAE